MITVYENKDSCCGCGACSNACPKGCIIMKADTEGFLYPQIDKSKCVNCGKCRKVCPFLGKKMNLQFKSPMRQSPTMMQTVKKARLEECLRFLPRL